MRKAFIPVDKGLNYSSLPFLLPETQWKNGINVHFGDGYVEKVGGWQKFFPDPLNGAVIHMDNFYTSKDDAYLMLITPTSCYSFTSGNDAPIDITGTIPLTGDIEKACADDTIDDTFIFTNQIDPLKMWTGEGTVKNLPGAHAGALWAASIARTKNDTLTEGGHNYICTKDGTSGTAKPTFPETGSVNDGTTIWEEVGRSGLEDIDDLTYSIDKCKFIVNFAGFCIVGGTTEDGVHRPQRMRWSQWNNKYRWKNNSDTSGQAGWMELSDGVDWLQNARPLGNYLIVYKERSICILSYVGGDEIWQQRPAIIGIGLLAPQALLDLGDEHIFIGPDNAYSYNLMEPKSAGDDIRTEFFRLLDPGYTQNIRAFFIEETPEASFAFTSVNSLDQTNDMALVYNTETRAWSIRELPMTAFGYWTKTTDDSIDNDEGTIDSDDTTWDDSRDMQNAPTNLCADKNGYIYQFGGHDMDGADIAFSLESGLTALDEPTKLKRVKRIQLMVSREGPYNLRVEIGTAANVDEDVIWQQTRYMSLDRTTPPWIDCDVTGRYFAVRLSNDLKDQPVRISGLIYDYELRGAI